MIAELLLAGALLAPDECMTIEVVGPEGVTLTLHLDDGAEPQASPAWEVIDPPCGACIGGRGCTIYDTRTGTWAIDCCSGGGAGNCMKCKFCYGDPPARWPWQLTEGL